jgi:hypothetical protein
LSFGIFYPTLLIDCRRSSYVTNKEHAATANCNL